jgi:Transglycosylase SLT domain
VVDIPPEAAAAARSAQQQVGASDLAAALALAVAWPESGYNPNAEGDWMVGGRIVARGTPGAIPTSFGYTQLHTNAGGSGGGLGNGHSDAELKDPVTNFAIAERAIQARLDGGADELGAIGAWSTRHTAIGIVGDAQQALGEHPAGLAGPFSGTVAVGGLELPRWAVVAGAAVLVLWATDAL